MVVRISSGANPTGAVYYNENKVGKGEADRLAVRNYEGISRPVQDLTLGIIASQLEDRASENERVSKPTFHVSLSLAQGEKPGVDELLAMADRYMDGMGYGRQPYVVYQHHDTDHNHLHIVSVRVDENGKKVPDKFERERSNKLRQQIEKEFGLQVAEKVALRPERKHMEPIQYGQGNLKRDLSAVVNGVLRDFTFSTFSQFNQLLGLYNVKAVEVLMEGKKSGLIYSIVDNQKIAQGAPYKASSLPHQPTMETVTRRMSAGKKIKGDQLPALRRSAGQQLEQSNGWSDFQQRLSKVGIEAIPHLGKDNNLFGISFVDIKRQTIYTGSELGKAFTAGSLKNVLGDAYMPPILREASEPKQSVNSQNREQHRTLKPDNSHEQKQHKAEPQKEETPIHNFDIVRQLLFALGNDGDSLENEQELKSMLKRARNPRRS